MSRLGGYDGPLYLASPNQGEHPDYYAAVKLLREIVQDLARSVSPAPNKEDTDE